MSKYTRFAEHLVNQQSNWVRLSFSQIEEIIGDALPASAHNHRAWWSNQKAHPSHPWAHEWMHAGWECETVSLTEQWVAFRRTGGGA